MQVDPKILAAISKLGCVTKTQPSLPSGLSPGVQQPNQQQQLPIVTGSNYPGSHTNPLSTCQVPCPVKRQSWNRANKSLSIGTKTKLVSTNNRRKILIFSVSNITIAEAQIQPSVVTGSAIVIKPGDRLEFNYQTHRQLVTSAWYGTTTNALYVSYSYAFESSWDY